MPHETKEIVINSLAEYIEHISEFPAQEYYRGERRKYISQNSSALRPYVGTWDRTSIFPFIQMIQEFYKEIAYKLNEDKKDFIAFAQHHGIPTNLLDVTSSPLVALYFACAYDKKNEEKMNEDGIVYIVDDACIDVTELIHQFPDKNLIDAVFSNTPKELNLLVPLFEGFRDDHPVRFQEFMDELVHVYLYFFSATLDDKEEEFQKMLSEGGSDFTELILMMHAFEEELGTFEWRNCSDEVYFFLCLQYIFFKHAKGSSEVIMRIDFLPNMIYRPIIKFERGRNQQGLFLYQGYMSYIEPVYDFHVLAVQEPQFKNTVFKIKNKPEILKALDKLGINRKNIFCDYDSIAAYIKEKYDVTKEK